MIEKEFISTVYVVKDNKVLLVWNKKVKNWIPLGGHIEANELPCDSVIREAKEESGLDIELVCPYEKPIESNLIQPIDVHVDHITDEHKHINLTYFGKILGGVLLEESDEQTPLKWFTKEDIEQEDMILNVKVWALEALNKLAK